MDRGSHIGSANVTTTNVDELSEPHSEHKSIEGMRTSCSTNINEVSGQVKYKNKQYRSRYDIRVNGPFARPSHMVQNYIYW